MVLMMFDPTRTRPFPTAAPGGVLLSKADLAELTRELETLRRAHQADMADRLREAREFGTAVDDDDHLAVMEDTAVMQMRIAHLERLIASAVIVETNSQDEGVVELGSRVLVRDDNGKETEYEIVGRRASDATVTQVTPASPVGEALMGASEGDRVQVELPSGRRRALTILRVVDDS